MTFLFGYYPMSIRQMQDWARNDAGRLTADECARAINLLDGVSRIRLKRAD